jgi:hypothetical protein
MKKFLVSALVAAMVLGLGSTAFAVTVASKVASPAFTDIAGHKAEAELTLFAALGIFTGSSGLGGAVKPDDAITRAEFSKVIVLATGRGTTAAGLAGLRPTFTDEVPAWAWGFVNVASYMGVIGGYPDGTFKANSPITYAEAVTMLVRAIPGHKAQVGAGLWPYNFLFYAVDTGFTGAVDVGFATLPCSRGDMARLLFATMQVDPLNADGEADAGGALLEEGDNLFTGVMDGFYGASIDLSPDYSNLNLAGTVYLVGGKTFEELVYLSALAVSKDEKVIFVQKTDGKTIGGVFASHFVDELGDEFLQLADGTKVPYVDCSVDVRLNGATGDDEHDLFPGDELLINLDGDGNAVAATALRWDFIIGDVVGGVYENEDIIVGGIVKSTADTPVTLFNLGAGAFHRGGCSCHFNGSTITVPASVPLTINGATAKADDLATNDVVKIATLGAHGGHGPSVIKMAVTRNVVKGTVVGTSTTFPGPAFAVTLKVDGVNKTYDLNTAYLGLPGTSQIHQYALNAGGDLFWSIGFTTANPVVYITGSSAETSGTTTRFFVTADVKGVTQTFECDFDATGWADVFATLSIDNGTGLVTGITPAGFDSNYWEVVGLSTTGVTLLVAGGSTYQFVETPVVYDDTGATVTYIGAAGLIVGDFVRVAFGEGLLVHVIPLV